MATPGSPAKIDTPTTGNPPLPASLMCLLAELHLDIIERVVNEAALHTFERSKSGETLYQIWYRLFLGDKLYTQDERTHLMTRRGLWSSLSNLSSPKELYTYRPYVALLHTNHTIREECREVYWKFSKKQMASYKAKHGEMLPMFIDGYWAWKERLNDGPGKSIGPGKDGLRVEGFELAVLCIRWCALKEICELLEGCSDGK